MYLKLPWRRGLVLSSPSATEETGAKGREIEEPPSGQQQSGYTRVVVYVNIQVTLVTFKEEKDCIHAQSPFKIEQDAERQNDDISSSHSTKIADVTNWFEVLHF
jgi:hypothetical protein